MDVGVMNQEWFSRVAADLIFREEVALGVKCKTCGQDVKDLAPGTVVESMVWGERKVGPVASRAVVRAYADQYRSYVGDRVAFIDWKTGALCFRERKDVTVVHGYVHIESRENRGGYGENF